jgi:hypothetical protein
VAAASLAAEAAAWRKHDFSSSSSSFGNAAAAWWWQRQQQCVGSGSMAYADNDFNRHDGNDDSLLVVPLLQGSIEGGGRGLAAMLLVVVAMDGYDNCNGDCLSKNGFGQGKKKGGIERWVCFFYAVLFCYCFLAYLFQCRSIDFCHCCCVLLLPLW